MDFCIYRMQPVSALKLLLCVCIMARVCNGTASRDLTKLNTDFFAWQMAEYPVMASNREIHKHGDQLRSFRMDKMNDRKDKVDKFYERLKAIPKNELNQEEVISYKILNDMLSTYINGYQWKLFQNISPVNFLEGPQLYIKSLVQDLPFYTLGDFENYIVRLQKFPQQYDEMKTLMREAVRLNRTYHRHSMSRVEGQFKGVQVEANVSEFYWPFTNTLDNSTIEEGARDDLRIRGLAAVTDVLDALNSLWEFIRDEYIPNTRPEIGISSLDGGMEYYEACIRWYLSERKTAKEIHEIGLKEVDRIVTNMQVVMARHGFDGNVGEYFRKLMNDSRFFFNTGEDLMEEFRHQIFSIIEPKMDKYFNNNPRLPLEVRSTPTDSIGGYYTLGSADGTRPGIFWLNGHRPQDYANFTMMALSIHESNPGHHLQISIGILSDTPDFRKKSLWTDLHHVPFAFPDYTAFVEGWALYSEYLGEEMGLYRDDYELMGRYSSEIFRACRLVVDTGIHAFGWTREDSIEYFLNYTAETHDAIALEIDRYITWPGQALAYKIGEIKIRELRTKAEESLGSKFDIQEFHSVVLENANVPLSILEDLVNNWIDSYSITTPTTKEPATCATTGLPPIGVWTFLTSLLSMTIAS